MSSCLRSRPQNDPAIRALRQSDVVELRRRPARRRVVDRRPDSRAYASAGLRSVGVQDGDLPIHARVLHPGRPLDERSDVQAVEPGTIRRLDRELEPRHLTGSHVVTRLRRDTVEARPAGLRRSHLAVASEYGRLVLPGIAVPRSEVGDLAHAAAHPPARPRVVEGNDRGRALAGAQRRVTALPVPRRVEAGDAERHASRRRDAGSHAGASAGGSRRCIR
jgi:hypothetical protein